MMDQSDSLCLYESTECYEVNKEFFRTVNVKMFTDVLIYNIIPFYVCFYFIYTSDLRDPMFSI